MKSVTARLLPSLLIACVMLLMTGASSGTAWGQLLMDENFSYATGQLDAVNGGGNVSGGNWVNYSGTTLPIMVTSGSLTYPGYISSGIGNKVDVINGSAEDAYRAFTTQTGTVYASVLMNVTTTTGLLANSSTTGDYTVSLLPSTSTTALVGRVSIRTGSVANTFNLGMRLSSSNATATFIPVDYPINVPVLVVVKYEIISGNANDIASLWVNPAIGGSEPPANVSQVSALASDPVDLARITIRQGTNSFPGQLDGFRVGTSWAYILPSTATPTSDIVAAGNEAPIIDYAAYQASSMTTTGDGLRVWSFTIRDGAGSPDADTDPTILSAITFTKGSGGDVASWASTIREAAIFNGSTKVAEVSVTGETIVFSGLSGPDVTAADDGSLTLDLYLTFETAATDDKQYEFEITNANVTAAGSGSSTFTTFAAQTSSIAGDNNRVNVIATKLAYSAQPPASVPANSPFSASVEARDANDNLDKEYGTAIGLSVATGTGVLSSVSGLSQIPVNGVASWSDLKYNTAENGVSILASSGALTTATSNTFDVTGGSALSDVVAGVLSIPATMPSLLDTQGEEVAVFDFTVRDGGGSPDPDANATTITALTIVPGASNTISDWSAYFGGAELYDGVTLLGTGTIAAAGISFSGAPLAVVADDASSTLTLKVWLKPALPAGADGKLFHAKINQNTDVTVDPLGSMMAAGGSDVVGGTGTAITVDATALQFTGTITNKKINTAFSAGANAVDANGNIDAEFVGLVTFAIATGPGNLSGTTSVSAVAGTATTTNLMIDAGGTYTLSVSASGLTQALSNSFVVESPGSTFKIANVLGDTLLWRDPSIWTVESGADADNIPDDDIVILDNTNKAGNYVVKIGYTGTDSARFITVGYPGNTNKITLLIPNISTTQPSTSFRVGDGIAGNYDLTVDAGGVLENASARTSGGNIFIVGYSGPARDSVRIRAGGKYFHRSLTFTSFLNRASQALDGDYGTVEFDIPFSATYTVTSTGQWLPNLVFSNTQGAAPYILFSGSTNYGPFYIKGNLTINPGATINFGFTYFAPVMVFGDVVNNGTMNLTTSPLALAGVVKQTISGNPPTLGYGLVNLNPAGVDLQTNITISGQVLQTDSLYSYDKGGSIFVDAPCYGGVNTLSNTVYLNPAGSLYEGANPILGNVSATRTLGTGVNDLFGKIGMQINAAATAPGATTVVRKTGVASTGNGNQSILRYYDVTPATDGGLNASLVLGYKTTELNGLTEMQLIAFKSINGGANWSTMGGLLDGTEHTVTLSGLGSIQGRWTAASSALPLAITHSIVVRKLVDTDGNPSTAADQSAKQWGLSIYRDSISVGTLLATGNPVSGAVSVSGVESGTFIAVEADSLGWQKLGVVEHGTSLATLLKAGEATADTIVLTDLSPSSVDTIDFINFRPNAISVGSFADADANMGSTGDRTAKPWYLEIRANSSSGALLASGAAGTLSLSGLGDGTYYIAEADSASWIHIGQVVNGTPSTTSDNSVLVTIAGGQSATVDFVNAPPAYSATFRTATMTEWATAVDGKGKTQAIKCKPDKVEFDFLAIAPASSPSTAVKVKIGMVSSGVLYKVNGDTATTWNAAKEFTYSAAIAAGETLRVYGWGTKGKAIKAQLEWATTPKVTKVKLAAYTLNQPRLPMPNLHNVGSELSTWPTLGNASGASSVIHPKYKDVQKTLNKKGTLHTGAPRCINTFANGKSILKQQKSLPPDKHSNKLMAEVLTLGLNLGASNAGKFPTGLGALLYDNPTDTSSASFNGSTVADILVRANSFLGCVADTTADAVDYYNVISLINGAFTDGNVDTVSWSCAGVVMTGVRSLIDVPYLHAPAGFSQPKVDPVVPQSQLPSEFALYQNFPNPFNPTTTISFDLPEEGIVTLKVYNMLGQEVATLLNNTAMDQGEEEVEFDAGNLPSGVYFYRLTVNALDEDGNALGQSFAKVGKMMLVK